MNQDKYNDTAHNKDIQDREIGYRGIRYGHTPFGILFRSFLICCLIVFICLLPGLLVYFIGYAEEVNWNNNAKKTQCLITSNNEEYADCIYSCGDFSDCNTNGRRYMCTETCYYGSITTMHQVNNQNYYNKFRVTDIYRNCDTVNEILNRKYPVGSTTTCYYHKKIRMIQNYICKMQMDY